MSSFLDKIRTLINAQVRGPRHTHKQEPQAGEQPAAPAAVPEQVPEVVEGRSRKPKAEVTEVTPKPAMHQEAPAPRPEALRDKPVPPRQQSDLDEGRVADMLKKREK